VQWEVLTPSLSVAMTAKSRVLVVAIVGGGTFTTLPQYNIRDPIAKGAVGSAESQPWRLSSPVGGR
jgi:hypothetical protein